MYVESRPVVVCVCVCVPVLQKSCTERCEKLKTKMSAARCTTNCYLLITPANVLVNVFYTLRSDRLVFKGKRPPHAHRSVSFGARC